MSTPESTADTNIEAFHRIAEESLSGDLASFDDLFAEDIVLHTPLGPFAGREAVRTYFENFFETAPDAETVLEDAFGDGDEVAGRWRMTGTHTGDAKEMGLPATGRRFDVTGALLARFEAGRCVEMWSIWDKMEFLQQLGLFPDSPGNILRLVRGQLLRRLGLR